MPKRPTELLNQSFDLLNELDHLIAETHRQTASMTYLERVFPEAECDYEFTDHEYALMSRENHTLYAWFIRPNPCQCPQIREPRPRVRITVLEEGQWMAREAEQPTSTYWEHEYWEEKSELGLTSSPLLFQPTTLRLLHGKPLMVLLFLLLLVEFEVTLLYTLDRIEMLTHEHTTNLYADSYRELTEAMQKFVAEISGSFIWDNDEPIRLRDGSWVVTMYVTYERGTK